MTRSSPPMPGSIVWSSRRSSGCPSGAARSRRSATRGARQVQALGQAGTDYGQSSAFTTLSFDRCLVETTVVRLAQMKGRHQDWNTEEFEKGVVLLEVSLKATPEDILLTMHPLVTFNLHAMARYFERAFGRADEDGLLAAIWNTLSDVPDILVREEEDFHLPIPEAGEAGTASWSIRVSSAPRSRAASRWTCGPSTANRMRGIREPALHRHGAAGRLRAVLHGEHPLCLARRVPAPVGEDWFLDTGPRGQS